MYVIVGHYYEHVGLMVALEERGLLSLGEYWVVGVDPEQYDASSPTKYLRGLLSNPQHQDPLAEKAFRCYVGVVTSAPVNFEEFARSVNTYMERPPFNFPNPLTLVGGVKTVADLHNV